MKKCKWKKGDECGNPTVLQGSMCPWPSDPMPCPLAQEERPPWTEEDQMELLREANDFNRGNV